MGYIDRSEDEARRFISTFLPDTPDGWIVLPDDRFRPYGFNGTEGHFKADPHGREMLVSHVLRERAHRTVRIGIAIRGRSHAQASLRPLTVSGLWLVDQDGAGATPPPPSLTAPTYHIRSARGGPAAFGWALADPLEATVADALVAALAVAAGDVYTPVLSDGAVLLPGTFDNDAPDATLILTYAQPDAVYTAEQLRATVDSVATIACAASSGPASPTPAVVEPATPQELIYDSEETPPPDAWEDPNADDHGSAPLAAVLDVHARLHEVEALAREADILARLSEEIERARYAGSTAPVVLAFLTFVSRLLVNPMCLIIRAASAAGKSYSVDTALLFTPPEAYYALTAMSNKALAYTREPLEHRILVIGESKALEGQGFTVYALRELISSGRLRYEYVDFEAGSTTTVEKNGPTGLILTTTGAVEPELATRMLEVGISESSEQTRLILGQLAERAAGRDAVAPDYELFQLLQLHLAEQTREVVVPFASALAGLVDAGAIRVRRDFQALLTLISAHALLHQATRARDERGRIVASLRDYEAVHGLVAESMAVAIERTVAPQVRQTVQAVAALSTYSQKPVSAQQLAEHLGLDGSSVRRRVAQAVDAGYLVNEGGGNRPHQVKLGEPLPEDRRVLPDPEQLSLACRRACTPEKGGE